MTTLQDDCNKIGSRMRKLEEEIAATPNNGRLVFFANRMHEALAQGFVNQAEPLGADWDQMAAATYQGPAAPPVQPSMAGVKHKPPRES